MRGLAMHTVWFFILLVLTLSGTSNAQVVWVEPQDVTYLGVIKIDQKNDEGWWIKNKENAKLSCGKDIAMFLVRNSSPGESITAHGYIRDQRYGLAVQEIIFGLSDNNFVKSLEISSFAKKYSGILKFHPGTPGSGDIPFLYLVNGTNKITLCICKQTIYDNGKCQAKFNMQSLVNMSIVVTGEIIKMTDGENPDQPFNCLNVAGVQANMK